MEALRPDSLISSDIHEYFLQSLHHNDMRVCTFYELKPVAGLRDLVSPSNVLGGPWLMSQRLSIGILPYWA